MLLAQWCMHSMYSHLRRWSDLDQTLIEPLDVEAIPAADWLKQLQDRSVQFLGSVTKWARGDYREAAELTMLALGVEPPRGTHILRPGACHHARWMAKASEQTDTYFRELQYCSCTVLVLYFFAALTTANNKTPMIICCRSCTT